MANAYITEAFKRLNMLDEDVFDVTDDGIQELKDFEDDSETDETVDIIDPEAENEDELEDSYVGKVILDCCVCHSKIYKNKEEVHLSDDETIANEDEECPYCYSTDGFKVIGEVAEFSKDEEEKEDEGEGEEEDKVEVDDEVEVKDEDEEVVEESAKKTRKGKSLKESFKRRKLKESWGDVYQDLIDRAKSWIDDGDDIDEAVSRALDDGLIYTSDIMELGSHYGVINDSQIISDMYEDLYSDIYSEVSDYYEEARAEDDDNFNDDIEEGLFSKKSKLTPPDPDIKIPKGAAYRPMDIFDKLKQDKRITNIDIDSNTAGYYVDVTALSRKNKTEMANERRSFPIGKYKSASDIVNSIENELNVAEKTLDESCKGRKCKNEPKLQERNLTRWERHNRDMDRVFRDYDARNERMAKFLKDHGVSDDEIAELKNNTGLGRNALDDKMSELGIRKDFFDIEDANSRAEFERAKAEAEQKEMIKNLKWAYGFTTKEAKDWIKSHGEEEANKSINKSLHPDVKESKLKKVTESLKVKVYNIDYDIEDEDVDDPSEIEEIRKSLPSSLVLELDSANHSSLDYEIADAISNETGWLVNDFDYDIVSPKNESVSRKPRKRVNEAYYSTQDVLNAVSPKTKARLTKIIDDQKNKYGNDMEISVSISSPYKAYLSYGEGGADFVKSDSGNWEHDYGYIKINASLANAILNDVCKAAGMCESVNEDLNEVTITTDDTHMEMTSDENGKVTVTTEPVQAEEEVAGEDEEVIAPLDDKTKSEIENNDNEGEEEGESEEGEAEEDEVEADIDEFDTDNFDELGESFLKKSYNNVDAFKTTGVKVKNNSIKVEGLISFKSGAKKKTHFVFEAKDMSKRGKYRLIGENLQLSRGHKSFTVIGTINNKKFVSESLNYNYRASDANGKSQRVSGTVRVSKK